MKKRALLSVSDKSGLVDLAHALATAGYELVSTGGTAKAMREAGLTVLDVSDITGFPEMMDGRVKTLHPIVHGGLLHLRDNLEHVAQAEAHDIAPIDVVVVNLYPFEATIQKPDCTLELAIENIDIGGPSMLRSAAKNYRSVTVVTDPEDYAEVITQLQASGETTPELRAKLARKVYQTTSRYDTLIADYLEKQAEGEDALPAQFAAMPRVQSLRYGENPHQAAGLYGKFYESFEQLHGKELSYNNLIDIDGAVRLIHDLRDGDPAVAILKHTNPCGVGQAPTLREAWDRAYATDHQAPFGGIIVCNRELDLPLAEAICEIFSEVIIAPSFAPDALARLEKKKNLRLIVNKWAEPASEFAFRSIVGSAGLVQSVDQQAPDETGEDWRVVTEREPTDAEWAAMRFGWKVVKHVKSNAIVYANAVQTLGIGAGQMSRVDSSKIAVWKAGEAGLDLAGSTVCSDAFFPFADGLIAAADAGASAAIEPGGSKRDDEVIAAANERGMAMVFTGNRHFRH